MVLDHNILKQELVLDMEQESVLDLVLGKQELRMAEMDMVLVKQELDLNMEKELDHNVLKRELVLDMEQELVLDIEQEIVLDLVLGI